MEHWEIIVIGAGWAGLSASYALKQSGLRHVVLERGRIGETWRTQRWASFHMNTPNALTVLPGDRYEGADPEGFLQCDEFIEMMEGYARRHDLPIREETKVQEVRPADGGFRIRTAEGTLHADALVVASGNLNVTRRPAMASRLPPSILQMDGLSYRRPELLPDGAVMVVGCGDTGGQITEELIEAGRTVFLSTGRNGRIPRRYRGRDIFLWMSDSKLNRNPRLPGTVGRALVGRKRTISLQSLSALGVVLVGRVRDVSASGTLLFEDSLAESVAYADETSERLKSKIDEYIARAGIDAPDAQPDPDETAAHEFPDPPILELGLIENGIGSVIWATGVTGDFSWLKVPGTTNANGDPVQDKSVSVPGVFFAGLDSKESQRAGTVLNAALEAERIARHLTASHG